MTHLNAGRHALLESDLQQRQQQLQRRLFEHHGGVSRAEHAREVLLQDGDDAPQRDGDRFMDMALSDLEIQELAAVGQALQRLRVGIYGQCTDCANDIPFHRLEAEPWAQRCVACEAQHESAARRRAA